MEVRLSGQVDMSTPAAHIVVIGAGPAGLTAAYELCRQGYSVVVLEASDAIGGISQTVRHGRNRMDIGGHRFFSKDERVMRWWKSILPVQGAPSTDDKQLGRTARVEAGGPDPEKTDAVMLVRHRVSRIYFRSRFFDYPISLKPRTFINMGLGTSFIAGCSYLWSCVHKLPEDSLENFYINRFGRKLYSMFFEGYTTKVWGRSPRELSADWGAQRVKGISLVGLLRNAARKLINRTSDEVETSLIEEFYYPKYGPGQLWETVAQRVEEMDGTILHGKRVTRLSHGKDYVEAVICEDGSSYEADYVFSSMPLCNLVPALGDASEEIECIAEGLPYRDFVTVGLLVNKLALSNTTGVPTLGNVVPDCWIYVQDTTVQLGRIQIFNNWSPYLLDDPEHTVWLGLEYFCNEGDALWSMSEQESVDLAIRELQQIGVLDRDVQVLDSCRKRMQKAYPAYFGTYEHIDRLIEYLDSFDNLYCIGRNGQHRYNNMDHSMATAFAAVDAMLHGKGKDQVWKVNTEQVYNEEK